MTILYKYFKASLFSKIKYVQGLVKRNGPKARRKKKPGLSMSYIIFMNKPKIAYRKAPLIKEHCVATGKQDYNSSKYKCK